jgi:hypothetical protein
MALRDNIKSVEMLEALILTATEAKEQEKNLNMGRWVTIHTCGKAACLVGYQALSKRLSLFAHATMTSNGPRGNDVHEISSELATDVEDCLGYELANSIYEANDRREFAENSELFSAKELDSFDHLGEDTNLEAAIDYMQAIVVKIKNNEQGEAI